MAIVVRSIQHVPRTWAWPNVIYELLEADKLEKNSTLAIVLKVRIGRTVTTLASTFENFPLWGVAASVVKVQFIEHLRRQSRVR